MKLPTNFTPVGLCAFANFSLTSSLVVKISTLLVSTISDTQICLLKNVSSFCKSHFCFSKNISPYKYDQSFNDTITNDIVSFEHLGPEFHFELFFSTAECSSSKHFSIMFSAWLDVGAYIWMIKMLSWAALKRMMRHLLETGLQPVFTISLPSRNPTTYSCFSFLPSFPLNKSGDLLYLLRHSWIFPSHLTSHLIGCSICT